MIQPPQAHLVSLAVALLVLVPLLYWRLRKMSTARPLKWQRLWVRPAIFLVIAALVLGATPPGTGALPWLALAALAGALAGWHWGRSMHIEMHPQNGTLMARGSQAAMLVLVVLVVVRLGLKAGLQMKAGAWHVNMLTVTDASIVFSALLFAARGLEMYLRARRVMEAHGAA